MSEIEQARIDVHHCAEQIAAVNRKIDLAKRELEKWQKEQQAIYIDFYKKCEVLARLREENGTYI